MGRHTESGGMVARSLAPLTKLCSITAVALIVSLIAPPLPLLASPDTWKPEYDRTLHGDFVTVGNTVTGCPPSASHCRAAESGDVSHGDGLNNDHSMRWVDVDDNPATYNSSTATAPVPDGGTAVHASLTWAGNLRAGSAGSCGKSARWPVGTPQEQAVSLTLNGTHTRIGPDRFTIREDTSSYHGKDRWYSATADVTAEVTGGSGPITATVGDIWTGQGYNCFGGWSLTIVWEGQDEPLKRIVLVTGHARVESAWGGVAVRPHGLRTAGGTTRIGVSAFEGDLGLAGDALVVNGVPQRGPGKEVNFFVANAAGAVEPRHRNNMSVDARTLTVGPEVVGPGTGTVTVDITTTRDAVLLAGIALSLPQPGLAVRTTTDRPVTHPDEQVTQTAWISNTGGVPLRDVTAELDAGPACQWRRDTLAPGATEVVTCAGPAPQERYAVTVSASATAPGGQVLAAAATSPVRVIHPAIDVGVVVADVAVAGQDLDYELTITNTGDTELSAISVTTDANCATSAPATLAPDGAATAHCTTAAGSYDFTVRARDELGATVADTARATVKLVQAGLSLDVTGPSAPTPGDPLATITVRLRNTGAVPLIDVLVAGSPAACRREIGRLDPGQAAVYTCRAPVDTTVRLVVTGTPLLDGAAADARFTARAVATLVQAAPPLPEQQQRPQQEQQAVPVDSGPPQPEPIRTAGSDPLSQPPATAAIIAVLGVLMAAASAGAISSAVRGGK